MTVSSTVQPLPTVALVRRLFGPMTQSVPIVDDPQTKVWGRRTVSWPMWASGPTQTWSGSSIETPEAMSSSLIRRCMTLVASASWMRELTPRSSVVSPQ